MKKLYIFLFFCLAFFQSLKTLATHLRAGEITAVRISSTSLTYRVTITTYTDEINGKQANDAQEDVDFYPGFSNNGVVSYKVPRKEELLISPTTKRNIYETVVTYPAPGVYHLSCGIVNRNDNTINLPQPSDSISWFVQSTIVINASFGLNSTPVLLNIPIDSAAVGTTFIHNPGAFDIDGDSLSYRLAVPLKDANLANGEGIVIDGYIDPSLVGVPPILNEAQTGPATFKIDARTGDLVWDAPQKPGQYNVAFVIEEWRKAPDGSSIRIGSIERDMQIIVVETENNRPELEVPDDLCIEAGEELKFTVRATDVDAGQQIKLTSSGGVYNKDAAGLDAQYVPDDPATFTAPALPQLSPVEGTFAWLTNCDHVRQQAYDVLFKVEDEPGRFNTQLADIKTIKINVNPPSPKGLTAEEAEGGVQLSWLPYAQCNRMGRIFVFRKDGCSGLNPDPCQEGIPAGWSYTQIGEVGLNDTEFLDETAEKGQIYSYRLVSELDLNTFVSMKSAPSAEFCIGSGLQDGLPILTNVTVEETNNVNGEILVKWSRPLNFDQDQTPGPYMYKLYRTEGLGGDSYVEIATVNTNLLAADADTVFTDSGLNTTDNVYKYKLEFFAAGESLGEAPPASSVRLNGSPDDRKLNLSWVGNTPWSNDNFTHYVYREDQNQPGQFHIIAAVDVAGPNTYSFTDSGTDQFLDDGDQSIVLENNVDYCYKVETVGVYENQGSVMGELHNFSQIFCLAPADRTPPCPPVLSLTNAGCDNMDQEDFCASNAFTNNLTWTNPTTECREDLIRHNVYFARYENGTFNQVGITDGKTKRFDHLKNNVDGFAGCYYVTAVSVLNVESAPSNVVCADNCEKIAFPNVFTPNGDGKNDTFEPMNCPAFVKHISYEIYNRQGLLLAEGEGEKLSWDGRDNNGNPVSAGTFFYRVKVQFNRLEENSPVYTYKGYLEIIR
ncbi:gliding motility-associated C-terminal domain-containing protein [Marinilongibacter aquaticus]|uniref:gliding motility-associated C-terminal domain-containing protein n=1 Tax=Marinilongibacter aquaticus TaxID=2975157 RepID=UPI0021BD1EB8|nr:gliding motility-associated C-terminal domain-containing protein [Marinilongibacter aquaticus]UBM57803.1 gliding motility-associated C-terminal domain-containing protein [Marinilongibacter aquaticus]